jgi:hypothetical protein
MIETKNFAGSEFRKVITVGVKNQDPKDILSN